jgi:hypothetical protein
MRAAQASETAAYDSKAAAQASARTALSASEAAADNATYIAGRVNAAMTSADQAALSESHAGASAGAAWRSEANAKQSELMAAEYSVGARDYASAAAGSASAAAASATAAAASAEQTASVISNFNANVDEAAGYASLAGASANRAQTYAVSAADSADRAEAALGLALQPLANYYTKAETESLVGGEASIRGAAVDSLSGDISSLASLLGADYYTKAEINQQILFVPKYKTLVVDSLPSSDIDDEAIYLVTSGSDTNNLYTEYVYADNAWEQLGTQELDLSGYETTADIAPYKLKLDSIESGAQVNTVTGVKGSADSVYGVGNITIGPANLGLGNVDNTADSVKSVASASLAGVAGALGNIDSLANYSVGDVVFDQTLSPSTCYVCISGSSVPGGE